MRDRTLVRGLAKDETSLSFLTVRLCSVRCDCFKRFSVTGLAYSEMVSPYRLNCVVKANGSSHGTKTWRKRTDEGRYCSTSIYGDRLQRQ